MSGDGPIFDLDTTDLRQRSVRGAAVTSGAQIIKFVLMLGSQILLARLLNPLDFGIIAMVAPVLGFVVVMADLGIAQVIVQRPGLTGAQLNSVFWLNNALTFCLSALLMLSAPLLAWLYHEPRLISVTLVLAALVAVTGLSMQQSALLNRMMRFSALAVSETLSQAAGLTVTALAALKGFGYWSLVMGQAATTLTAGIVVWSASSWRPSLPSFRGEALSMLRFGGNITVSNVAQYLNTVFDNVLVGYWLGAVLLGIYDRAWKLVVMPLGQLMAPLNRVAVPALSRLADNPERYQNAFGQMFRLLLLISLPGLVIGVLTAEPLIRILFGVKWQAVGPVFFWLCLGSMLTPLNTAIFWLFVSQGRARDQMIYGTAAALINMTTYVIGIHWGLLGVARTSAIVAFVVTSPVLVLAACRKGPIDTRFVWTSLYPAILATVAAAAALELYAWFVGVTGLMDLVALAILAYGASLLVLSAFATGRATLREAVTVFRSFKERRGG